MTSYRLEVTTHEGGCIVIAVAGDLTQESGQELTRLATGAIAADVRHIDIELGRLRSFTDEGIMALSSCSELGQALPDGLDVLASGGAGRDALLALCRSQP